jgi:hypothetical protein
MTRFPEEIRQQLDEVYQGLMESLQHHPEDAPGGDLEEILAKCRVAEAMLAGEELDEDDRRLLPPKPDDD